MKKYRRIEITAFRRRVQIVSGETKSDEEICLNDAETREAIELESAEGQRILTEAVRILEENLTTGARKDF